MSAATPQGLLLRWWHGGALRWGDVDSPADTVVAADLLRLRAAAGLDVGDLARLSPRGRRAVAVASAVGAPVLPALDGAAEAEADARRSTRAVAVASAQTRTVAGGLLLAPVVLVPALGRLVGVDLVAFYRTPVGLLVGAAGAVLLVVGAAVVLLLVRRVGAHPRRPSRSRHLLSSAGAGLAGAWLLHPLLGLAIAVALLWRSRATPVPPAPGVDEAADLTATALAGGVAPGAALRAAAGHLPEHARDLRRLAFSLEFGSGTPADVAPGLERLGAVLGAATDVGAPAGPALRRLATELRADDLARVLAAAERLPAQLTFPTALALLPATLLLIGAPILQVGLRAATSSI